MRRSHVVLSTAVASLGLLLVLLSIIAGHSDPTLAAPPLDYAFSDPLKEAYLPLYQAINCTLATTTTDSLASSNNYTHTTAVALANYTGLALSPGDTGASVPAEDDWFRRDNANPGSVYEVEAVPDKTSNYNLGIVVYDASLMPVTSDIDPADDNRAKVELEAENDGPYYFKVYQLTPYCTGETYHLSISVTDPQDNWDAYEGDNGNNSLGDPSDVSIGGTLEDLNFWPYGATTEEEANVATADIDVFRVWCKPGHTCRAETTVTNGVDTVVKVYADSATAPGEQRITENDDHGGTLGSQVTWESSGSGSGYYKIWVENRDGSPRQSTGQTYNLILTDLVATPTPTPGPTSTPKPGSTSIPGLDQFEPNYDFAHAATLGTGITYQANFIPWGGATEDNDYYKIWIKPGLHFTCETLDLAPGVDTNMIVYDGNYSDIGGNDDVELGEYRSRLTYFSTYEGWLYILVGHGGRLPSSELENSDYKLLCEMQVPGQPTATGTPEPDGTPDLTTTPGATPTPSGSPIATTPTPAEDLTVRPLTTPTPVPATTPAPHFIPISLLVYFDANDDRQPGAGEGVSGISVQAYEVATNQLLAQGFTDEQGNLEFTVASSGPARVSVPFFGFSQLVAGEGASIYLRVPPQPLPEGAP